MGHVVGLKEGTSYNLRVVEKHGGQSVLNFERYHPQL